MQEGRRYAILVGNSQYNADEQFENLRCPVQDAEGLAEVLSNWGIGRFDDVQTFPNRPHTEILEATEQLIINQAGPNDLILFYFSGHGKLDRQGRLYLAVTNTHTQTLGSTAIPIAQLKDFIDNGRSTRLVMILDCCFSGAAGDVFATPKGHIDSMLHLLSSGRGKYILTASTASQTAQEKELGT